MNRRTQDGNPSNAPRSSGFDWFIVLRTAAVVVVTLCLMIHTACQTDRKITDRHEQILQEEEE